MSFVDWMVIDLVLYFLIELVFILGMFMIKMC